MKSVSPEANLRFVGAAGRQGPQMRPLCQNGVGPRSVAPGHQQIHGAPVIGEGREVAVAALDQRLGNGGLEMAVLRWRFWDSTAPFSCASPRLLRLTSMPQCPTKAS